MFSVAFSSLVAEDEDDEQDEAQAPGPGGGGGAEEDLQAMAEEGAHHATPAGLDTATEANADDAASSAVAVAGLDQSTDDLSEEESGGVAEPADSAQGAATFPAPLVATELPEDSNGGGGVGILEPEEDGDDEDGAPDDLEHDTEDEEAETEADSTLDTSFTETEADTSVEVETSITVDDDNATAATAVEASSSRVCGDTLSSALAFARPPGPTANHRRSSHRLSFAAASVQPVDFSDLFPQPTSVGPSISTSRRRSSMMGYPTAGPQSWSAEEAGQGPRTPLTHANSTPRGGALLWSNLPSTPLVSAFGPEYSHHPYGGEWGGSGRNGASSSSTLQRRTTMETWQRDLDDMHSRANMMRQHLANHTLPPSVAPSFADAMSSGRSLAREMHATPGRSQRAWPFAENSLAATFAPPSSPCASDYYSNNLPETSVQQWPPLDHPTRTHSEAFRSEEPPHSASGDRCSNFSSWTSSSSCNTGASSSYGSAVGAKREREVRRSEVDGDSSSGEEGDSGTEPSAYRARPKGI